MDTLVTLMSFAEPTEMAVPKSFLESEGIECFIQDELISQIYPWASSALGGIKLQVRESDLPQAVEIMKRGGFLSDEDLQPSGIYQAIGAFLEKIRKK